MLDVVVVGATGRLGSLVVAGCHERGWRVVSKISSSTRNSCSSADVIFEAASSDATQVTLQLAMELGCPVVLATSGRQEKHAKYVEIASRRVPVVVAPNLSFGSYLLFTLANELASFTPVEAQIVVSDRHPVHKKDAPSGTAKYLAGLFSPSVHTPQFSVTRGGPPVADHAVSVSVGAEKLSLELQTLDLSAAKTGAIRAIEWAGGLSTPGLYDIKQMYQSSREVDGGSPN